eukprot:GHUV01035102.1.p1 GENE.GHUV01035102.1~~GHUV01035102.1.p1  ORF type:complete len:154 (-),score=7.80 GHUV01035102.1:819-1280(-)
MPSIGGVSAAPDGALCSPCLALSCLMCLLCSILLGTLKDNKLKLNTFHVELGAQQDEGSAYERLSEWGQCNQPITSLLFDPVTTYGMPLRDCIESLTVLFFLVCSLPCTVLPCMTIPCSIAPGVPKDNELKLNSYFIELGENSMMKEVVAYQV